jgi:hypothetical protein
VSESTAMTMAIVAIHLGLLNMLTSVKLGLISPNDVDASLESVSETLEKLPSELHEQMRTKFDNLFLNLKRTAALNWKPER